MKDTMVSKVYNILKSKKTVSLKELYEYLPEHSQSSIRGNINRHVSKASNKLFTRKGKGIYCLLNSNESTNKSNNSVQLYKNKTKIYSIEKYLASKITIFNKNTNTDEIYKAAGFEQLDIFNTNIINTTSTSQHSKDIDYNQKNLSVKQDNISLKNKVKTLSGAKLAGGNPKEEREENDFYATDPSTVELFLDVFHKDNQMEGSILECACGQGHISKVLKKHYPNNEIVSTDLIDRGYGIGGIDFLTYDFKRKFNNIITNPPFKFIQEFIERALELSKNFVIMFAKIQLLETVSRKKLFENSPLKYIYVHSTRQATWKKGQPTNIDGKKWQTTFCHAWFVWDKSYKGEPIVRWI